MLSELPNVGGQVTVSVADASVATITGASYADSDEGEGGPTNGDSGDEGTGDGSQ
jgi:hypothetical protein